MTPPAATLRAHARIRTSATVHSAAESWSLFRLWSQSFQVNKGDKDIELLIFDTQSWSHLSMELSHERGTVKPPRRHHIGDWMFGPCKVVGPISEVFLQIHCMSQ